MVIATKLDFLDVVTFPPLVAGIERIILDPKLPPRSVRHPGLNARYAICRVDTHDDWFEAINFNRDVR